MHGLMFCNQVHLENYVHQKVQTLSVPIAFIGQPRVIILDEMSSGVDISSQRWIVEFIQDHKQRNPNSVVFMWTHSMSEVEKLLTQIAIFAKRST